MQGRQSEAEPISGTERAPSAPVDQAANAALDNPAAAEAQRWITYQYLLNTPEEAPQRIGDFVRAGLLEANPDANAVEVLGVFLGLLGRAIRSAFDEGKGSHGYSTPVGSGVLLGQSARHLEWNHSSR